MFGIKGYIYLTIGILLFAAIGGAYWYFQWSQAEIKTLNENIAKQEIALQEQKQTIVQQQEDAKDKNQQLIILNDEYAASRTENVRLRNVLSKHNIGYLASKKPGLVQKILTNGSNDAERCYEILSGSPLTEKELAATKRSQINKMCPETANPNFKGTP